MVWPNSLPICSERIRATLSVGPPGANPIRSRMGFSGQAAARAVLTPVSINTDAAPKVINVRVVLFMSHSRILEGLRELLYTVAMGFSGEPTAPGKYNGGAVNMKAWRPFLCNQLASSVKCQ